MQVQLDFERVPAIAPAHTVQLVNAFCISTAQFFNKFSVACEQKLLDVGRQLQRLTVTVSILESKLRSVDGLSSAAPSAAPSVAPVVVVVEDDSVSVRMKCISAAQPENYLFCAWDNYFLFPKTIFS
jgi:hypothetical protein